MITKIQGEQPFQVLTNNFSISPSNEGYTLQISADGKQYSNLFSVGAGVTRLVTGVAANSYYRLLGNHSQVSVNWMKTCVTEGGAAGNELIPQESLPENADPGTVVALSDGGVYQFDGTDWNEVGAGDFSAYWTSAETKTYVDSADTIIYNSATTHIEDVERIMSSALNEFHTQIVEVSGDVQSLSAVTTGMTGNLNALSAATTGIAANVQTVSGDVISLSAVTTGITGNLNALSGEVQSLSAATAGKADAASITANTGGFKFPLWNTQGVITGLASSNTYYMAGFGVNGKNYNIIQYNYNGIPGIYAPLSAGTAGNILVSTGNGAPVWSAATFAQQSDLNTVSGAVETLSGATTGIASDVQSLSADVATIDTVVSAAIVELDTKKVESTSVHTIWKGTQAEYDLIQTKDPATFYIIIQ